MADEKRSITHRGFGGERRQGVFEKPKLKQYFYSIAKFGCVIRCGTFG